LGFAQRLAVGSDYGENVAASNSNHKRAIDVITLFGSVVLDLVVPVAAEMIETETVSLEIDDVEQAGFECYELRRIHLALEDRGLDALAVIKTSFGGPPQAGFPGRGGGGDVVGDEDIHGFEI